MNGRFVFIGIAVGVAALVLAASVFLGPPAGTEDRVSDDGPGVGAAMPTQRPDENGGNIGLQAEDWTYQVIETVGDDKTRITLLSAAAANTQGQGITHLVRPQFQVITTTYAQRQTGLDAQGNPVMERYATGGRAMILNADTADMEMDGNQPQRGVFQGNVRITLLDAEGRAPVINESDPRFGIDTEVQRIFIDGDTRFGLDTNDVRSDAPVHVTSLQADFYGVGLVLKYNTARQRIEQLVVSEGRYLMYDADATGPAASLDNTPDTGENTPTDNPVGEGNPDAESEPRGPSQFYLATFSDNIVVRDTDTAILGGDALRVRFSLGTEAVTPEIEPLPTEPVSRRLPGALPGLRYAQAGGTQPPPLPPPFDPALVPQGNRDRTLYRTAPEDSVVITWTGPLRLVPLDAQPDDLVDDRDVAVQLTGDDAFAMAMKDGETTRILAAELSYTLSSEFVAVAANDQQPLAIFSTDAGTLTGEPGTRMTVDIKRGTATVHGPGTLTQEPDEEGKQLVLAWTDRLDMDLYTQARANGTPEADSRPGGQTRVTGIRTATFRGGVTATHPDFDLAADQLAVAFNEPDDAAGIKNDPSRIVATVDVTVLARGDAEDERFDIQTQSLTITLKSDTDGKPYADTMRAIGQVRIARPGSVMTCHRLDAALTPPSETEADPDDPAAEPRFAQVRSVVAVGDVRAEIEHDGRRINLVADHLLGDIAADRLTLYATEEGELAEVIDVVEDRLLRGRHIEMDDQAQLVRVEGAGAMAARMEDPDQPGNADARMTIDWQRSMQFNNATGRSEFHGTVVAETRRTADTSDLSCDDLDIWFTQREDAPADTIEAADNDAAQDALTLDAGGRDVRKAIATGNVRFVAATRAAEQPDQPHSRVTITGPELVFTNQPTDDDGNALATPIETVVVTGEGWMLIEDYTPEDPEEAATRAANRNADEGVTFSGKGQTAFLWQDRMHLDARANTATFDGGVRMAHDPTPNDRANHDDMHMDCQQLIADMHDTGGLGVWMSDTAPQPEISVVTAQGPLRIIRAGREIQGDHLRYVEADRRADIWADPNRDVILQEESRPAPVRCGRVIWDLARNRIEMRNARGGVAPAER